MAMALRSADDPRQLTLLPFDGATYIPSSDGSRLSTQFYRVLLLMSDSRWRTLAEIVTMAGGTEASVSARLRDFRKAKFGGTPDAVDRRRRGEAKRGLHEYRLAAEHTGALLRMARGDK